ncbi:hypothetical protein [Sphingomonas elodea]|uniref:hypothetical protein n=1 Tax=Sphingomonas elodea TaxID=179878 RepID=UPI001300C365|nr:hypothetical protein [Sphingomonas elodea]
MTVILELMDKLRKSMHNNRKLCLSIDQAKVLLSEPIYNILSKLEAEALTAVCDQDNAPNLPPRTSSAATNSDHSGFGTEKTGTTGAYAGTTRAAMDPSAGFAASRLASAAVAQTKHRKPPKTH